MKTTRIKNFSLGQRKSAKNGGLDGIDLRQETMWEYFVDRRSDSWNNATKSAIKAGYAESTAENITREQWFRNKIQQLSELLPKAEEVLWEDLNMEVEESVNLRRIRSATAMFICETVGRNKYTKKLETENVNNFNLVEGNPIFDDLFRKSKQNRLELKA